MRPEYEFRGGRRGRHAAAYAEGKNLIRVDRDVAEKLSPTEINRILRDFMNALEGATREATKIEPSTASAKDVFLVQRYGPEKWQIIGLTDALADRQSVNESAFHSYFLRILDKHDVPNSPLLHMWHTLFPTDEPVEIIEMPAGPGVASPIDLFLRKR